MPQSIDTYGGGGAPTTTRTEVNSGPAGLGAFTGGPSGPSGFYDASFMNFLRRRRGPAAGNMAQGNDARLPTPNERALDDAKTQALLAQYKAESEPAPLTYTPGGFNMPSHLEQDIHNMTGAQRSKFLPQNAGLAPADHTSNISKDMAGWGLSDQDIDAKEGGMMASRGANAGDVRRQQYIKDRQLQDYYGTGGGQQQREGAPNQYGSGRG
jgi:hypothetical protein